MDHRHPAERSTISAYINRFRNSPPRPPAQGHDAAGGVSLPAFWWQENAGESVARPSPSARNYHAAVSVASQAETDASTPVPLMAPVDALCGPSKPTTSSKFLIAASNSTVSDAPTAEVLARAMAVINSSRKMFQEGALAMPVTARLTPPQPAADARSTAVDRGPVPSLQASHWLLEPSTSVDQAHPVSSRAGYAATAFARLDGQLTDRSSNSGIKLQAPHMVTTASHTSAEHETHAHARLETSPAAEQPSDPFLARLPAVQFVAAADKTTDVDIDLTGLDLYVEPAAISIEDPEITIARLRRRLAIMDHEIAPILAPYVATGGSVQYTSHVNASPTTQPGGNTSTHQVALSSPVFTSQLPESGPALPPIDTFAPAESGMMRRLVTTAISDVSLSPQAHVAAACPLLPTAAAPSVPSVHAGTEGARVPASSVVDEFAYEREVAPQVRESSDSSFSFLWDLSDEESVNMTPAATVQKLPNKVSAATAAPASDKSVEVRAQAEGALPPRYGAHRQPDVKKALPCDACVQTDATSADGDRDISASSSMVVANSGAGLPADINALFATVKPIVIFMNGLQPEAALRHTAIPLDIPTQPPSSPQPAPAQHTFRLTKPIPPIVHIPPLPSLSTQLPAGNIFASSQPLY